MPARRKGRKVSQKTKRNASKKAAPVAMVAAATTTATTTSRKRKAVFPSLTDDPSDGSNFASDDGNGRVSGDDDGDGSDIGVRSLRHGKGRSKGKGKGKSIAQVTKDSGSDEDLEEDGADDEEDDMQWEDVLNVISAPEAAGTAGSGSPSVPNPKRDLELTLNRGKTEIRYLSSFQSHHAI